MKRLLLSMTVMFAFAMTSQAQVPGGDGGLGGGGGDPIPDLIILNTTAPDTWLTEDGVTFEVTVRNMNNAAAVPASRISIGYQYSSAEPYPANTCHSRSFDVPAFAQWEIDKVITVTFDSLPLYIYGYMFTLIYIQADGDFVITEANETNNTYTP